MLFREKQALDIARRARELLLEKKSTLADVLRMCWTVCQLMEREKENEWIKLELDGYDTKYKSPAEQLEKLPDYRKVMVIYRDDYGNMIPIDDQGLEFLEHYPLAQSVEMFESYPEGLKIRGRTIRFLRNNFQVPVSYAEVAGTYIHRILGVVRNRCLEFLNRVILELEFGEIPADIFREIMQNVDSKLAEICPSALAKLTQTYASMGEAFFFSSVPTDSLCLSGYPARFY